jgi:hypothetical protein
MDTQDRHPRSTRRPVALGAAAAAIVTAALVASAGSAQTSPSTLHLVGTAQKSVGFMPKGAPHQGDRLGFGDKVTGDDTGYDRGVCTVMKGGLVCTIQVQLSKGTLTAQGIVPERSNKTPIAITGGTGAYDGARGTALVTDVSQNQTDVNITLRP